jgi:DNA repair ATPase RecN
MNTQKIVFNKLAEADKVELSAQKVELGIMQDVKEAYNEHKQQRKNVDNTINDWYSALFKVRDKFPKIENEYKQFKTKTFILEKAVEEMESIAKELGVQPNSLDFYNSAKSLINTSKDIDDEFKEAKKIESKIG